MSRQFYKKLIKTIKDEKLDQNEISKLKISLSKKYHMKKIPSNIEILLNSTPQQLDGLKIVTKPVRTISGVATISIMTRPAGCAHGKCTFCPGGPNSVFGNVPQSYTGHEPATMRAIRNKFDPYLQVFSRLEQYAVLGQEFDKIELIIQGGTFPSMNEEYQNEFIGYAYKAFNDFSKYFYAAYKLRFRRLKYFFELNGNYKNPRRTKSVQTKILKLKEELRGNTENFLKKEKKRNETARVRCVGLTIETKPDWGFLKEGNQLLELGCTRVELGIQTVYDEPLKLTNRGHTIKDTIKSIRILKDLGFKVNAHYMLGMPGLSPEDELKGLKKLFTSSNFKPDMLKIYPLLVIKGTPLYLQWKRKQYKPMSTETAADIISEAKRFIPKWVRIMRVNRDIPTFVTSAGIDRTNLRQYVQKMQDEKGIICNCIRCKEAGRNRISGKAKIYVDKYKASNGLEFFISMEAGALIGFCRMRFPSQALRAEITKDSAIVRELHVYSPAVAIGKLPSKPQAQHRGYGKMLLKKAEQIAKDHLKNKLLVISGVGAKKYYQKLGYYYDGPYMAKLLK